MLAAASLFPPFARSDSRRSASQTRQENGLCLVDQDGPCDLLNGLRYLDGAGAGFGAVDGGAAPEHAGPVAQDLESFIRAAIAGIEDEPVGVDDRRWAHVPPISPEDRAGSGAGSAQDALRGVVKALPLLGGLDPFPRPRILVVDQVGEHGLVALEERLHVHDEIFQDWQSPDRLHRHLRSDLLDQHLAGQIVLAVDQHGIRATDAVSARTPKSQGAVVPPLHLVQCVQDAIRRLHLYRELVPPRVRAHLRVVPPNLQGELHQYFLSMGTYAPGFTGLYSRRTEPPGSR